MDHRFDEGRAGVGAYARAALRVIAASLLVVYVAWNVLWLAQGRIPPSLLVGLFDVPGPTTGGTRSILALSRGDWSESLRLHALAVPIAFLFSYTVGRLVWRALRRQRLVLPAWVAVVWIAMLSVAWAMQFARA